MITYMSSIDCMDKIFKITLTSFIEQFILALKQQKPLAVWVGNLCDNYHTNYNIVITVIS